MHHRFLRRLPALTALLVSTLAACTNREALPAPAIEAVSPAVLPSTGGTLTVTGTNFYRIDGGARIRVEACGVTVDAVLTDGKPNTITLPPGGTVRTHWGGTLTASIPTGTTPGISDVIITRPDGQRATLESALECEAPPVPDTEPPTLTLEAPTAANLGDTLALTGTTTDDIGVTELTLRTGDTIVASLDPTGDQLPITLDGTSWSVAWTPDRPGQHDLTVTASDAAGNEATATATITVAHDYAIVTNTYDDGYGSLRSALAQAQADTPITFDPAVFDEPKTILLEAPLEITTPTTIRGPGETMLVLDGNGEHRVIENLDGHDLVLQDLTIQNGHALGGNGGGILFSAGTEATLALDRVTLRDNHAHDGGALHITGYATLTITDSTVTNNDASGYGGGLNASGTDANPLASITVDGTTVTSNTATSGGGGIRVAHTDSLHIEAGTVTANHTDGSGGGLDITEATNALIVATVTRNNAARHGGGVHIDDTDYLEIRGEITDNVAGDDGGGLHLTDSDEVDLYDINAARNTAGRYGGGIYNSSIGWLHVRDSIVTGNHAGVTGGGLYLINRSSWLLQDTDQTGNTPDDLATP